MWPLPHYGLLILSPYVRKALLFSQALLSHVDIEEMRA